MTDEALDTIQLHEPIDEIGEDRAAKKMGDKRKKGSQSQVKPGFIAIFGSGFVEAKSKRELRKLLDAGGHQDAVIIRGKIVPTARVTRLAF
jgi:hypothetical protein